MAIEIHELGEARIRVWAAGEGPPLVYLHGMEQHPGDAPFLQRLARHHHVFAPELPGYGASTGFEGIDDILDLVLFERRLIESLGAGIVDVVGHDLGGMVAAELAALCPWLVRKVVLVDAYGLWTDEAPPADPYTFTADALRAAKWHDPATAPDPEPNIDPPDPADPAAAMLTRAQNLAISTKFLWPIPDRGLRKRLSLITAPTLVVHGASDGLIPLAHARALAALVPGAELTVIVDAGHLPMIEQVDAFIDVVEGFLAL